MPSISGKSYRSEHNVESSLQIATTLHLMQVDEKWSLAYYNAIVGSTAVLANWETSSLKQEGIETL